MSEVSPFDALSPYQISVKAAAIMENKALRPPKTAFLLAIMAGIFIGLGFIYCVIVNVSGGGKIVGGLVFSLGLTLVLIVGGELFTSTTLTLVPRACKRITWGQMLANWGVVYVGNFVGALTLVGIILLSGHPWDYGGKVGLFYINLSVHKLSYTFTQAVFLGIMCNLMVCLGVWMSYAGRSVLDKMAACLFPVGLFIACGFEHSVANMYMIPIGIVCSWTIPAALTPQLTDVAQIQTTLQWTNFLVKNLLPVTIGNIIGGGVMVGLFQWMVYLKDAKSQ